MAVQWFCKVMGEELGPMSQQQLVTMARSGQLTVDDTVRKGIDGRWVRAELVQGLFDSILHPIVPVESPTPNNGMKSSLPAEQSHLAVITRCPHCDRSYRLPPTVAGQRAKCKCGLSFVVSSSAKTDPEIVSVRGTSPTGMKAGVAVAQDIDRKLAGSSSTIDGTDELQRWLADKPVGNGPVGPIHITTRANCQRGTTRLVKGTLAGRRPFERLRNLDIVLEADALHITGSQLGSKHIAEPLIINRSELSGAPPTLTVNTEKQSYSLIIDKADCAIVKDWIGGHGPSQFSSRREKAKQTWLLPFTAVGCNFIGNVASMASDSIWPSILGSVIALGYLLAGPIFAIRVFVWYLESGDKKMLQYAIGALLGNLLVWTLLVLANVHFFASSPESVGKISVLESIRTGIRGVT